MVQFQCPAQKCLNMGLHRLVNVFLSAVAVRYACTATVLRLRLRFLSPFASSNRRFSFETKLSGRAVQWQQSVSQSSDRWTTLY